MIFRQLFEPNPRPTPICSAARRAGAAVLIDPVLETAERDLDAVRELGLTLAWTVETHVHADHVTAAARLQVADRLPDRLPAGEEIAGADAAARASVQPLEHRRGSRSGRLFTPGHTDNHHCYLLDAPDEAACSPATRC